MLMVKEYHLRLRPATGLLHRASPPWKPKGRTYLSSTKPYFAFQPALLRTCSTVRRALFRSSLIIRGSDAGNLPHLYLATHEAHIHLFQPKADSNRCGTAHENGHGGE